MEEGDCGSAQKFRRRHRDAPAKTSRDWTAHTRIKSCRWHVHVPKRIRRGLIPQPHGAIVGGRQQQTLVHNEPRYFVCVSVSGGDNVGLALPVAYFPEAYFGIGGGRVHAEGVTLQEDAMAHV